MEIRIYTDGGSSGNPGPAAIGYVVFFNERKVFEEGRRVGVGTNNFAEYSALIAALEKTIELIKKNTEIKFKRVAVFSDSLLMVSQINGLYKIKNSRIRECVFKIRALEQEANIPISYKHVPREKNILADSLVRKELY